MPTFIWVTPEKCSGCRLCEMACAMKHFGRCQPQLSRIQIRNFCDPDLNVPVVCMACEDAPCIKVCPVNARGRQDNGAVVTDDEICIGCRACLYICPNASPVVNRYTGRTMTCDLCRGEDGGPWCVAACRDEGALAVDDGQQGSRRTARNRAGRIRPAGGRGR